MNFLIMIKILYLLIPAAIANIMPVLVKGYFKFLAKPVDFNLRLYGKRLFGDHKTFRGFIFGIIGSIIFVFVQYLLYGFEFFKKISLINYSEVNILLFGFLIGFGVLFGDLIGSFIKRRFNFKPGKSFLIIDQINGGVGFVIFIIPIYIKSFSLALWIILIWTLGHFILKYLGYLLRIDKEKI